MVSSAFRWRRGERAVTMEPGRCISSSVDGATYVKPYKCKTDAITRTTVSALVVVHFKKRGTTSYLENLIGTFAERRKDRRIDGNLTCEFGVELRDIVLTVLF